MAHLFLLNQRYLDLATSEAKAAAYGWDWWTKKEKPIEGTLLLESRSKISHLGLTKRVVNVLAICAIGNLKSTLGSIKWKLEGKRYRVEISKQAVRPENAKELAAVIWHTLKNPKVDLDNPEVIIDIVLTSKTAYVGIRIWENNENFESRRAHLRPHMHPSSMHPAIARALVNITCSKSMHDPCCGSGGILIEAGLSGLRCSGADIEPTMIAMAKANCAAYGLHPELRVADAVAWIPRTGAIIADLPYGKSTSPVALQPFLDAILLRAAQSTSRAIIGLPQQMRMPKLWSIRSHMMMYVHKSMTKHFYLVEKV